MRRAFLAAAVFGLVATLFPLAPGAEANHSQNGVTFDSLGGNEWWVDVQLGGSYSFYGAPAVRDTNGDWQTMQHPDWAGPGRYVASIHVEPGHQVKFRLSYKDSVILSCWFSHPAGVENCDGSETFAASFTPSGNADRIQVTVDSNQPVSWVFWQVAGAMGVNDMALAPGGTDSRTTWVNTGTPHVPDGTLLRFTAHSEDDYAHGDVQSGCFRWPAATLVPCPPNPYVSAGFPESYDGDPHHMEAYGYYSSESEGGPVLDHMEVRFDGGDFQRMYRAPPDEYGFNVNYHRFDSAPDRPLTFTQFRAVDTAGQTACEDTGFLWPQDGTVPATVNTGDGMIFANRKGNTGYVQVNVYASWHVAAVEAQVNGGPWRALEKKPWCDWAAAMDAPAGTIVFRGYFDDLTSWTSEAFSWQPDGGGSSFVATFDQVKGNEWWQQVRVSAAGGTLSTVDVRVNGGTWKPLTKQTWGTDMWAGSYQAKQGSTVQFQATSSTGSKVLSSCYAWIPASGQTATPVSCGTAPAFDATFTGVRGNTWWVQADVTASGGTVSAVEARVNCSGTWHPLAKQSWGPNAWAASFNVPAGSKVDLRARSTTGATDLSGGYVWPDATPTSPC